MRKRGRQDEADKAYREVLNLRRLAGRLGCPVDDMSDQEILRGMRATAESLGIDPVTGGEIIYVFEHFWASRDRWKT